MRSDGSDAPLPVIVLPKALVPSPSIVTGVVQVAMRAHHVHVVGRVGWMQRHHVLRAIVFRYRRAPTGDRYLPGV